MKSAWGLAAVALLVVGGGCATEKKAGTATIAWNIAMEAALADAGKQGRPILLDFYTDW